jgi:hypothetical protein
MLSVVPSAPFVVPPLLLIAVLVVSGVAKIRDPRDTWSVFDKLRLPRFLSTLQAPVLLPYGELVVAAALFLLPDGWYVVAATLTLLLFVAYFVVVARALSFGYPLLCGCFGQLGLGWITRQTLVRNGVLLGLAVVTFVDSWRGEGVLQRLTGLGDQAWWLAAVAVAVVTTALVVREGKPPAYVPPEEYADSYVAQPIPYALLDGPAGPGSVWSLSDTAARLLVFADLADISGSSGTSGNGAADVLGRLQGWAEALAPVEVHAVGRGEWSRLAAAHPDVADRLLGDPDGDTALRLRVFEQPGAVLLGTDRLLAGGPVTGLEEIDELVQAAAEELRAASAGA